MTRDSGSKARGYVRIEKGIYQRGEGKDARLAARYTDAYGKQRWVTAPNKTQLGIKLTAAKAAKQDGKLVHVTRNVRLEVYAQQWIENYAGSHDGGMQATTMRNHSQRIKAHIIPHFGKMLISNIEEKHVREFKTVLLAHRTREGKPMKPASIKSILKTLNILMNSAVRDRLAPANPLGNVTMKLSIDDEAERGKDGHFTKDKEVLSVDELVMGIDALPDPSWEALVYRILAETGLRVGELSALTYHDVFTAADGTKLVEVTKAWSDDTHSMKPPKNRTSRRQVPINEELYAEVEAHRKAAKWDEDTDFLFPQPRNRAKPLGRSRISRAVFDPVSEAIGRRITPHLMRHTFISHRVGEVLAGGETDIATVSKLVGHANSRITLEVYTGEGINKKTEPTNIMRSRRG